MFISLYSSVSEVILTKIAVFSDTHGRGRGMTDAVMANRPDAVIHCGDGCRDTRAIETEFPDIPVYGVAGNCDYEPALPLARTIELNGVRIYIAHGHTLGVRYGNLDRLAYAAEEAGAQIALYGHTHRAKYDTVGNVAVINPGSAGMGGSPTWGILEINPAGEFMWKFMDI
jgi:putative phosphoesterase